MPDEIDDGVPEAVDDETSRYVTVFHQLTDTDNGERGDRYLSLGKEPDDRYKPDDEAKGFVAYARPIAIIDAGVKMTEDEFGEWCNSHAGKAVLARYFPEVEVDDPTLPDCEEYLEDGGQPTIVTDGGEITQIERKDGRIHVTFEGEYDTVRGWSESREDLGLNKSGDPVPGLELIEQNGLYHDPDDEYPYGYSRVVLAFDDVDALEAASDRLYSKATERFEYGMHSEAEKVQRFAGRIPSEWDVDQAGVTA
jgi:hypothetical protein